MAHKMGEALYRALSGGRGSSREPDSFDDAIAYFLLHFPSISALARFLGEPRSSVSAWSHGRVPYGTRRANIVMAAKRHYRRRLLSLRRERRMRGGVLMHVSGTLAYDGSEREFDLDDYLTDGWQDDIIDAWLDGADPDELMGILHDHLTADFPDFYERMFDPDADPDWQLDVDELDWGFDD